MFAVPHACARDPPICGAGTPSTSTHPAGILASIVTRHPFINALASWAQAFVIGVYAGHAVAQTPPPYVFSGPLLPLLLQMPENAWLQANANLYSNVWTSPSLEPLDRGAPQLPSKIIIPWSSFAWDSNRGDVILYGGGHANYPGNDVYRWHSSTLQWERASL